MKTFKFKLLTLLMYISCTVFITVNCNKISQGEQRRKFEFLYKINNQITVINEYTKSIAYFKNLGYLINGFIKFRNDISEISPVQNWDKSLLIKNELINLIDSNVTTITDLQKKNLSPDTDIRNESEVLLIDKRISDFTEELSVTIIEVGKE